MNIICLNPTQVKTTIRFYFETPTSCWVCTDGFICRVRQEGQFVQEDLKIVPYKNIVNTNPALDGNVFICLPTGTACTYF